MIATEEMKSNDARGPEAVAEDHEFLMSDARPIRLESGGVKRLFIRPFGVIMGRNISGQQRAQEAMKDPAMTASIKGLGVQRNIEVRRVEIDGRKVYQLITGNRRTALLRYLIAKGEVMPLNEDGTHNRKALLPIELAEELEIEGIDSDDARNLLENSMRKAMSPIAKAHALYNLKHPKEGEPKASEDAIKLVMTGPNGKPLGKSMIYQYLNLRKLHPSVQDAVDSGLIPVNEGAAMASDSHEEQLQTLQAILDAKRNGGSKPEEIIKKSKLAKRVDEYGEKIHRDPMASHEIRATLKEFTLTESWDCLPGTSKLNNEGYGIVTSIFKDLALFCEGGLTTRNVKDENLTLTLKTRILSYLAPVAPK